MIKKMGLTVTLLIGLLITSIFTITPVLAGGGKTVYGMLYVDDNIASPGIIIRLEKIDGELIDETQVCEEDNGSNYLLVFSSDYEGETGYFNISIDGTWYTPEDNTSIYIGSWTGKRVDLHVDTSSEESGGNGGTGGTGGSEGGTGGGTGGGTSENKPPIAIADANKTYVAVGESILFDGSHSVDDNGIVNYTWDFKDGYIGYGVTVIHSFTQDGKYDVVLTVRDAEGLTDTDTVEIQVTISGNYPPENLNVLGPTAGDKDVFYSYNISASDPDGDSIRYIIDWGDGSSDTSSLMPSGLTFTISHNWSPAGLFTVTVYAEDEHGARSNSVTFTMSISVQPVGDIGYLIDEDSDGSYDTFHNAATGQETPVAKDDAGKYLIDSNGYTG
ncbi:MAG TPA: PKD domain-containing protein [Thermoplasmatales archaeon]|nr:PKD domain-containing protein [Thermoplasmatales archaeon]